MLSRDLYLTSLERDVMSVSALDPALFDRSVPSCPEWNVLGLIDHLGWGLRFWASGLRNPEGQGPSFDIAVRVDEDPLAWFQDSAKDVLDAVHETSPSKPIAWLGTTRPASFVLRRVAHEAAIHRWDALAATGSPEGFDAAIAADGVDEVLELWVPVLFDYAEFGRTSARLHLHATDDEHGWLIAVDGDSTVWRHAHEASDVTARGTLGDLYLGVWGRGMGGLELEGDGDCLGTWQAASAVRVDKVVQRYYS